MNRVNVSLLYLREKGIAILKAVGVPENDAAVLPHIIPCCKILYTWPDRLSFEQRFHFFFRLFTFAKMFKVGDIAMSKNDVTG